jgi:hypothetical protein
VHDPPRRGIEGIAAMHGAAVIPKHQIADPPNGMPGELRAVGIRRPVSGFVQTNGWNIPGDSRGSSVAATPWRTWPPLPEQQDFNTQGKLFASRNCCVG